MLGSRSEESNNTSSSSSSSPPSSYYMELEQDVVPEIVYRRNIKCSFNDEPENKYPLLLIKGERPGWVRATLHSAQNKEDVSRKYEFTMGGSKDIKCVKTVSHDARFEGEEGAGHWKCHFRPNNYGLKINKNVKEDVFIKFTLIERGSEKEVFTICSSSFRVYTKSILFQNLSRNLKRRVNENLSSSSSLTTSVTKTSSSMLRKRKLVVLDSNNVKVSQKLKKHKPSALGPNQREKGSREEDVYPTSYHDDESTETSSSSSSSVSATKSSYASSRKAVVTLCRNSPNGGINFPDVMCTIVKSKSRANLAIGVIITTPAYFEFPTYDSESKKLFIEVSRQQQIAQQLQRVKKSFPMCVADADLRAYQLDVSASIRHFWETSNVNTNSSETRMVLEFAVDLKKYPDMWVTTMDNSGWLCVRSIFIPLEEPYEIYQEEEEKKRINN